MAVGLPTKVSYANGDVFSSSDINDTNGTINLIGQTNNFYAAKNKIINGDFSINQRAFSSTTSTGVYTFDRWITDFSGGTVTYSSQAFTPGAAPVSPYESANFYRIVTLAQTLAGDYAVFNQRIENVRNFAGQTVTVSFWAKAATGTPKIAVTIGQNFGSGGSPSASVTTSASANNTISTSWARYSYSVTMPSLTGKTVGTTANTSNLSLALWVSAGTTYNALTGSIGVQNNTFDIWGVQVESGSTATAFQTATGNIQSELAACQRYYQKNGSVYGFANGTTTIEGLSGMAQMRTVPTLAMLTTTPYAESLPSVTPRNGVASAVSILDNSTGNSIFLRVTGFSGMTNLNPAIIIAGQISFSAEF